MMIDTLDGLVAALRDSGLLDEEQQGRISALAARFPDAAALGRELQRLGWLTPYQTEELLAGRGGELVLGQYVVLSLLGQGGMGKVFKARHRLMKRVVALKVIRPTLLAEPRAVQRFHREIEAVSRLTHPNIVAAFDADQVGNTHFLVMEYVEGTDLARLVKEHGPLPPGLACDCIRQAALGLQHAHEQGMVHRDVKPANLLLSRSSAPGSPPVVKVLDLGLARLHAEEGDGLTHTGAVMGTPDYIAPEQASDSHRVDIRADLYSLGCTLYYLLTGEPPFPGGTAMEKLFKHQYVAPRPVEVRRPDLPPAVAAVVARLLAKRPEERYQTPAELAEALAPLSVFNPDDDATTIYLPKPPAVAEVEAGTIRPSPAAGETMRPEGGVTRLDGAAPVAGSAKSPGDWSASPVPFVEPAPPAGAVPAVKLPPPRRRAPVLLVAALMLAGAVVAVAAVALLWQRPGPSGGGTAAEEETARTFAMTKGGDSSEKEAGKKPATERENPDSRRTTDTGKKPRDTKNEPVKPEPEKVLLTGQIGKLRTGKEARHAAFSADGRFAVVSDKAPEQNELYVYSLEGDLVKDAGYRSTGLFGDSEPATVAYCRDGTWLFYGTRSRPPEVAIAETCLRRWFIRDEGDEGLWAPPKDPLSLRPMPRITSLAVSDDAKRVIAGTDEGGRDGDSNEGNKPCGVYLWDLTGKPMKVTRVFDGPARSRSVVSVALSGDGSRAVISTKGDGVRWWDLAAGTADEPQGSSLTGVGAVPSAVAITRKGDRILFADDKGTLRCRAFDPGTPSVTFAGSAGKVTSLAFADDGSRAVSGSEDGAVRLWDVATGKSLPLRGSENHKGSVLAVSVTPDRKYVYSAGTDNTIHRWAAPEAPK